MATEDKSSYRPGLDGIIAGQTSMSRVDPDGSLIYRGYDIGELATNASFEEVIWLLLHGELPKMSQLAALSRQLAEERHLPPPVLQLLSLVPQRTHPMSMLRTATSMLSAFDPDLNDASEAGELRKALRLIARMQCVVTDWWRLSHGQDLLPGKSDLTHAGYLLYQLNGEMPDLWSVEVLDTLLLLYAEHGFNVSTFAARVTASTESDMYAAVTSALGALQGRLHGGANEEVMKVLRDIGSSDRVEDWVKNKMARQERVVGFGHPVYQKHDARVPAMRDLARQLGNRFGQERWVEICLKLEEVMEREKQLYANVDLYAAPVLYLLGIPPELNTAMFACGRVAGWCAHVLEQHSHNRLIRPRSWYQGPARRPYPTGLKKSAA